MSGSFVVRKWLLLWAKKYMLIKTRAFTGKRLYKDIYVEQTGRSTGGSHRIRTFGGSSVHTGSAD